MTCFENLVAEWINLRVLCSLKLPRSFNWVSRAPCQFPWHQSLSTQRSSANFIWPIISTLQFCFTNLCSRQTEPLATWNTAHWNSLFSCGLFYLRFISLSFSSPSNFSISSNSPCSAGPSTDTIFSNYVFQMWLGRCPKTLCELEWCLFSILVDGSHVS